MGVYDPFAQQQSTGFGKGTKKATYGHGEAMYDDSGNYTGNFVDTAKAAEIDAAKYGQGGGVTGEVISGTYIGNPNAPASTQPKPGELNWLAGGGAANSSKATGMWGNSGAAPTIQQQIAQSLAGAPKSTAAAPIAGAATGFSGVGGGLTTTAAPAPPPATGAAPAPFSGVGGPVAPPPNAHPYKADIAQSLATNPSFSGVQQTGSTGTPINQALPSTTGQQPVSPEAPPGAVTPPENPARKPLAEAYTPEQIGGIKNFYTQNENRPSEIARGMDQFGVSAEDVAEATGVDVNIIKTQYALGKDKFPVGIVKTGDLRKDHDAALALTKQTGFVHQTISRPNGQANSEGGDGSGPGETEAYVKYKEGATTGDPVYWYDKEGNYTHSTVLKAPGNVWGELLTWAAMAATLAVGGAAMGFNVAGGGYSGITGMAGISANFAGGAAAGAVPGAGAAPGAAGAAPGVTVGGPMAAGGGAAGTALPALAPAVAPAATAGGVLSSVKASIAAALAPLGITGSQAASLIAAVAPMVGGGGGGGSSSGGTGSTGGSTGASAQTAETKAFLDAILPYIRTNSNNPYGSSEWTVDANGKWTLNTKLNANEQGLFDNSTSKLNQTVGGLDPNKKAPELLKDINGKYSQDLAAKIYERTSGLFKPDQVEARRQAEIRLAERGFAVGNPGYEKELDRLEKQFLQQNTNAANDAQIQAASQALNEAKFFNDSSTSQFTAQNTYQKDLANLLANLRSNTTAGLQTLQSQSQAPTGSPTDINQLNQQNYQNQLARDQQRDQSRNDLYASIARLFM